MGEILVMVLKVLFILVALVMTFFILLQEGKGGGLAGLGGTKAAGVEGVTNPIRRATAVLSVIFFLLAILLGVLARPTSKGKTEGLFDTENPVNAEAPALKESGVTPVPPAPALTPDATKDAGKTGDAPKTEEPAAKDGTEKTAEKTAEPAAKDGTEKPAVKTEVKAPEPEGAAAKQDEKPAQEPAAKPAPADPK